MPELNIEHPDFHHKPGEKRVCAGREWTFGQNQFMNYWRAGPKDGTVVCAKDYPHGTASPYLVSGTSCKDFEKAAERAWAGARHEYERALEVVKRYEAEK